MHWGPCPGRDFLTGGGDVVNVGGNCPQRVVTEANWETKRPTSMAEAELVGLFEKASKAARKACTGSEDGADGTAVIVDASEEERCTDALRAIGALNISTTLLLSTQVGKRLRKLTKHSSIKISKSAQEILQGWRKIVSSEANSSSTQKTPSHSNSDSPPPKPTANNVNDNNDNNKVQVKSTKVTQIKMVKVKVTRKNVTKTLAPKPNAGKHHQVTSMISKNKVTNKVSENKVTNTVSEKKVTNVVSGNKVTNVVSESTSTTMQSSSSRMEWTPVIGPIPKALQDSARDRIREMLVEALVKVCKEATLDDLEKVKMVNIVDVAVAVENALFAKLGLSKGKEKAKYRSIMFNIRDDKNPDFRRRILLGRIEPEAIVAMTSDEMASDHRKKETEDIKAKAMFECERGVQQMASTDQFKCHKCLQRKTTYFQMQTRSADEPMTTFVTCINCNAHWKF